MVKAKKYLAAFLATIITISLVVIPGAVGASAASADDFVVEDAGGHSGYAGFLTKEPYLSLESSDVSGADITAKDTSNNYVFLKQLDVSVTDAAQFNAGNNSFWLSGVNWLNNYDDLSQLTNNGYAELWVKSSAAVSFEFRLSATYGYYSHNVNIETTGQWQKVKLCFANFKAGEYATPEILSKLAGIKILFGANTLANNDEISFGAVSFYTDNTNGNGYEKVTEGEVTLQYVQPTGNTTARIDYSANGEKFSYSKKLTFPTAGNDKKYFDVKLPSADISALNLGKDGYISFWVKSSVPIATKYYPYNTSFVNTFTNSVSHLKNFGGGNVWQEYRIYKSELSNTTNLSAVRFYILVGSLEGLDSFSIEFSGFAVYAKLDTQSNVYQSVSEKSLNTITPAGNAKDNSYCEIVSVTEPDINFDSAYQIAVKNSQFYSGSNWQGAYFIYFADSGRNPSFDMSKITKDGYIKTYIKTVRPVKLLLSAYGEGYSFSYDIPVYISGSDEWQEILIPISRFAPENNQLPLGSGSGGSPIPFNRIMGFRWRVVQNGKEFLNTAEFDESGNFTGGESLLFGPLDFVRMIHANLDKNDTLDANDVIEMRKALLGSIEVASADADANGDSIFDILDLIHLKKYLAAMAPVIIDTTNVHTCGGGNGIVVTDKDKVLPDDTVINAFRNTSDTSFSSLYASETLLDNICVEAVSNNASGEAEVTEPTGNVIVEIPVSYLYKSDGVNVRNISSVKAAVKYAGGCKPVTITYDSQYVYITTNTLGDFCFYTGNTIAVTTTGNNTDLKVVLETDHPGVTGYDAVYTAKAYLNGTEIVNPVFTSNIPEIAISGNRVTVPASFKDTTATDGTKLTITTGNPAEKVLTKRHKIIPWRDDATKTNAVMSAAIGDVTVSPDSSSDFGRYYSLTVGENFYTLDYSTVNRLYMLTTWAGNNDFSVLANKSSYLRLWVKTPHSAKFSIALLDAQYLTKASATVISADGNTDWQAIDIPVSELNITKDFDLTKVLGVKLIPAASADEFLNVGETFTFGAVDLLTAAEKSAFYPLMIRNWQNVVTDNFDGTAIDENIWNVFDGEGTENNTGAVSKYNANALSVNNGKLEMKVVKEADGTFSIPRISTFRKYEQTYGLFTAKIKTPKNTSAGVNTAFWLLPSSGSWGTAFIGDMGENSVGEVDALETSPFWTDNNAQTAIHTWDKNGNKLSGNEKGLNSSSISSADAYTDVSCVWTENALYFYYDGQLVRKAALKSNSNEKVYPILSMSIAGYNKNSTWLGSFTDSDVVNLVSYVDSFSISK